MKSYKLLSLGVLIFMSQSLQSQVSVNVNIGSPPAWGPVGYTEVNYYYLPDIEAYYDVRASQFIFLGNGRWIHSRYLPRQYRNYDLYHGYKVVLNDYRGSTPYEFYDNHKVKYYKGYHGEPQRMVGKPSDNNKYFEKHNENKHSGEGKVHGGGHGKGKGH